MIHRDGYDGPITFECDSCGGSIDTECEEFSDAMSMMKEEGWSVRKVGGDWVHLCSFDCQKKVTRANKPTLPKVHKMSRSDALVWLGLQSDANPNDIKATYRRLIAAYHPDHGGTNALAQLLNEAYEILKK